jgi:hypothetical protein
MPRQGQSVESCIITRWMKNEGDAVEIGDILFSPSPVQNTPSTSQDIIDQSINQNSILNHKTGDGEKTEDQDLDREALLKQAYAALNCFKNHNYKDLSGLVHPIKGVSFTPYSTVDHSTDKTFKPADLSKAAGSNNVYTWGLQNGSGKPIQLSMSDYFKKYVYNAEYISAPILGINTVISSGNSLENVAEAYPDCYFIEFYFPGINPEDKGFVWCGLKLVFEYTEGGYMLVGVIHSEWTI